MYRCLLHRKTKCTLLEYHKDFICITWTVNLLLIKITFKSLWKNVWVYFVQVHKLIFVLLNPGSVFTIISGLLLHILLLWSFEKCIEVVRCFLIRWSILLYFYSHSSYSFTSGKTSDLRIQYNIWHYVIS